MNNPGISIEDSVAAAYPQSGNNDQQAREERASRDRQKLALGTIFKPFVYLGSNFLHRLWLLVLAVAKRVASAFNVNLDATLPPSAKPGAEPPSVEFSATETSQPNAPEEAAKETAKSLAAIVEDLSRAKVDQARLESESGRAYAAMSLQSLGSAFVDVRTEHQRCEAALLALSREVASKSGAPVDSMLSFLKSEDLADPLVAQFVSSDGWETVRQYAETRRLMCAMQLQFCQFAIDARKIASDPRGDQGLGDIVDKKIFQFADREMAELIFSEVGVQKDGVIADNAPSFTLRPLESKKSVALSDEPAKTGRSRFVGMVAGEVDHSEDEDDGGSDRVERQR